MFRFLFHLHSTYSDGSLTVSEIAKFAINNKFDCIVILDHARLDGAVELSMNSLLEEHNIQVLAAYEHSVGNTDLGIIGLEKVLPSHYDIKQICSEVKEQNGAVVYLHPFRNNNRHLKELKWAASMNLISAYECFNKRDGIVEETRFDAKIIPIYGIDAHENEDLLNITVEMIRLNRQLYQKLITQSKDIWDRVSNDRQIYFAGKKLYSKYTGEIVVIADSRKIIVDIAKDCQIPWPRYINKGLDAPWDYDCIEVAVSDGCGKALLYTMYPVSHNGMEHRCFELTQNGIAPSSYYNKNLAIALESTALSITIPATIFEFKYMAISINKRGELPSYERIMWPKPVWPPRTNMDYYRL